MIVSFWVHLFNLVFSRVIHQGTEREKADWSASRWQHITHCFSSIQPFARLPILCFGGNCLSFSDFLLSNFLFFFSGFATGFLETEIRWNTFYPMPLALCLEQRNFWRQKNPIFLETWSLIISIPRMSRVDCFCISSQFF